MIEFDALCDALAAEGVDRVFGIPGTQTIELFEALRRSEIATTLTTTELGAAFMANGYARASGRMGVLVTIGGPGFTMALTGVAEASRDSVPLLHIVGASSRAGGARAHAQAVDHAALAAPFAKGCLPLGPGSDPGAIVRRAVRLATEGGPGPVVIEVRPDLPADVPAARSPGAPRGAATASDPSRVGDRFRAAARPVFLLGLGALGEAARIRRLVEARRVPVVTTPSARGILPEDHELAIGFDALRGGLSAVNELFERADLVLAIGCRLGHNGSAGFGLRLPWERLVHVDADPEAVGATYPCGMGVVAEASRVVGALERTLSESDESSWTADELADLRARVRSDADASELEVRTEPTMLASDFFGRLRAALPRDAILVTDSGMHQILARRHYDVLSPRGLVFPSDFQSMGFGVPAAVGAALGVPSRPVVALVGDGGFQMTGVELATAAREGLPLVVIVWSDGVLNQIRLQQLAGSGREHAVRLGPLDVERFAEAFGVRYLRFGAPRAGETREPTVSPDALTATLRRALSARGPTVLEVRVGDSWPIRAMVTRSRVKAEVRRAIGPRMTAFLKRAAGSS